jgi:hypothetical protein
MQTFRCHLCGSTFCQPPFCRFYRSAEEAEREQEEFRKQWEATTKDLNEQE